MNEPDAGGVLLFSRIFVAKRLREGGGRGTAAAISRFMLRTKLARRAAAQAPRQVLGRPLASDRRVPRFAAVRGWYGEAHRVTSRILTGTQPRFAAGTRWDGRQRTDGLRRSPVQQNLRRKAPTRERTQRLSRKPYPSLSSLHRDWHSARPLAFGTPVWISGHQWFPEIRSILSLKQKRRPQVVAAVG